VSDTLEEFDEQLIDTGDVSIHVRTAGSGPALLLLHGYPETSLMWRNVAPALAADFTVVATDLRGYGRSGVADDPAPESYSKRRMADDQIGVMDALGHKTFSVAGHDRGARVAHRLGLDHPSRVERLAVLDIVPTLHMFDTVDRAMAETYFHWFFLSQPSDLPERLINGDPDGWIASRFRGRHGSEWTIEGDVLAQYASVFAQPSRVAATCADYRAAATVDLEHDRVSMAAGQRLTTPLLAMWGATSYVGRNFDVPAVWQAFAEQVIGCAAPSDHYIPEEAPVFTTAVLREFFSTGHLA